jgi:hypothetical protein
MSTVIPDDDQFAGETPNPDLAVAIDWNNVEEAPTYELPTDDPQFVVDDRPVDWDAIKDTPELLEAAPDSRTPAEVRGFENAHEVAERLGGEDIGDDDVDQDKEERPAFEPQQKRVNFTIKRAVDGPAIPAAAAIITFMRENPETFEAVIAHHDDDIASMENGETVTTDKDLEWLEQLRLAIAHADMNGTPRRATEREGSHWVQSMEHEGRYVGPSRPKMILGDKPTKVELLSFLTRKSGMGATHEFPMPHTGLWIRMRTPTNAEVVSMIQRLQYVAVRLGRDTKGQGFSNRQAIYNNALTDLALSCITHCSFKYSTPSDIEDRLSALDEPLLHHGLATTMYPGGFNYKHPCVADPTKCNHVEEAKLDMFSLSWYDNSSFNLKQRQLLNVRFSREVLASELAAYKENSVIGRSPIKWFDQVGVRMRVPSIAERREAGQQWIDGVVEMTHGAFNESPGDANRGSFIDRLGRVTSARQYAHWIDAIYIKDGDDESEKLLTEDREVIDEYLSTIMSDARFAKEFEEAILQFIDDSIIAMVAIPSFNCRVCSSEAAHKFHERFDHLIPLDVMSTFFTLAGQKVNQ